MTYEPEDRETERDDQNEKDNAALASLLSQRDSPAADWSVVGPSFVLKRERDIETAPAFTGAA